MLTCLVEWIFLIDRSEIKGWSVVDTFCSKTAVLNHVFPTFCQQVGRVHAMCQFWNDRHHLKQQLEVPNMNACFVNRYLWQGKIKPVVKRISGWCVSEWCFSLIIFNFSVQILIGKGDISTVWVSCTLSSRNPIPAVLSGGCSIPCLLGG